MFSVTLAFFIFIIALLLACLISGLTRIISGKAAFICSLLIAAAAICSVFIPEVRAYFNIPTQTPDCAAQRFAQAITDGDREALESVYYGTFDMEYEYDDEIEKILINKMLASYVCELEGEYELGMFGSTQKARITHLDVKAYCSDIYALASEKLEKVGEENLRSTVYESDKTYKSEIAHTAFLQAAKEIFDMEPYMTADEVTLELVCVKGEWYVEVTEELVESLHCGLGTGSMKTLLSEIAWNSVEALRTGTEYVYKHYALDPDYAVLPPAPDQACFGETDDPQVMQAVVDGAAKLLQGQELAWNADRELMPGSTINYYCDESILAIVWREVRYDSVCTFAEVKIADATQLRRRLTGDAYDSGIWTEGSQMAAESNAVLATGGDLYAFRQLGITSYEGTLYRCVPTYVDSCHFTEDGDMIFSYRGELSSREEAQQFLDDNKVRFSVAFGPVLIDDGEAVPITGYLIGEIFEEYCRSCIGLLDELHYVQIVMSRDGDYQHNTTLQQAQDVMVELGCRKAYTLDGGQTGLVVINNKVINRPTYGYERVMSDILCYATAVPENDRLH